MLLPTGYGPIKDGKRKNHKHLFYSFISVLKHL